MVCYLPTVKHTQSLPLQYSTSKLLILLTVHMYTPHTIDPHPGNATPFLYTATSLLPEHSVLTDVQQATGRNGQQWITCRSGGQGTRPEIWMGSELVVNSSTANPATIGLDAQHSNGLYHCLSAQSQREYFSLFLINSGTKHVSYQERTHYPGHIYSCIVKVKVKVMSSAV